MATLKCIYGQDKTEGLVLIFVHGLGGDLYKTWMSDPNDEKTFWPRWIAEDCDCTTWTLGYDAELTGWENTAMPLPMQGNNVLNALAIEPKLKNRPLLFIGHSLGGLLIKTLMTAGINVGVARYEEIIKCIRGVVFIATPHNGSQLANLAKAVKFLLHTNEQVDNLTLHNPHLIALNQQFLAQHQKFPFLVRSFSEEKPVPIGKKILGKIIKEMVVKRGDGIIYIPNEITTPLPEDHFSICKPANRDAEIHRSLIDFIREVINNLNLATENESTLDSSKNKDDSAHHIVTGDITNQWC